MRKKVELLFLVFFVSGFSGLIYESVWSHYVKLFLGHASYAQTLVLVVFIGGLAVGAWLVSRLSERMRNPLRLYAIVEAVTGVLGLVFHWIFGVAVEWGYSTLLPAACEAESAFCAAQWGLAALLMAPQSILLGATFPLVSSAVLRLSNEQPGHDIASLYFLNSLGAVLGVLASAFILIPAVGLPGTLQTAGLANIALAMAAYFLSKQPPPPIAIPRVAVPVTQHPREARRLTFVLLLTAFLTGLSSFVYEIVWIRMLSLVLGASTHAFELMLATFILGLALGGLWVRKVVDRVGDSVRFLALVQIAMGIAAAATIPLYNGTFDLMAWMLSAVSRTDGGFVIFNLTATAIALLVMLPATFCAGMTLPLITYRLLRSESGERSLGLVYAVNTVGAIAGVILAVHLLMGWLGLHGALVVGAAVDVILGVAILLWLKPARRALGNWGPALAGVAALVFVATAFDIDERRSASGVFRTGVARINPNSKMLFHHDGKTATVDVVEADSFRLIRTNGKSDASISMADGKNPSRDEYTMTLLGALPLGHRPEAKTAAIIGFGSGMSTAVMLASPTLERVDTIEIEPAMVEGAQLFRPYVNAAFDDPRSRIVIDDAKSFFARGRTRYDIIVSEPSNPWVSGVASLFTEEFYERLATYLHDGGILSQWLHTYEMDMQTLASILAAVSKTFPEFAVYSSIDSDIILIARKGGAPGRFDESVLKYPALQPLLGKLKLEDPALIHRRVVAHWSTLKPFVGTYGATANSDYFPLVDQRASKTRFTQARAEELTQLQAAPVPLLEMREPVLRPVPARSLSTGVTFLEAATSDAWVIHDLVLGNGLAMLQPASTGSEFLARFIRQWALECPADVTFERVLPLMSTIAERMNPRLPPENALDVWKFIAGSKCARAATPEQRQWIELFASVAVRDAQRMAMNGTALLDRVRGTRDESTEYAVIAATAGLLCLGENERAKSLLDAAFQHWLRPSVRQSELRDLRSQALQPPAVCPRPAG